ncbi:MFS transporter [Gordonibacter urolithinfaciens]|uniref:MFS transporter n=1 Tax=Gordonibacter urolithinfaciens TaxID=1335613 RepID=A0A7K0IDS9_9ACTN|nr:MFS transporter [Gordonibacter urolithinfaciens]MCB6562117.1 MFS transporter [Gordonibacter urolithinfaciens]MSA95715.1 MFS transporter [Gordonibacter urolithinfaciens]
MGSAKLWNTRFAQLFCIEATLQFGLYLTRPLIAGYAVSLGASLTLAGFLAGLLAAAALAARPASGIVADRLGKKDLLSVSCGLFAVSALGCALFRSIPLMALFLTLQGFAFAFKSTVVVSLASLVVPEERVGSGVGWLGVAYTIACALGPAFGSLVGDMAGYAGAFATSGALLSAGFVMAVLFKTPPAAEVRASSGGRLRGKPSDWLYGPALPLSAIAGLLMVAQGVTSSFVLVVGEMRGIEGAPLYFLLYSLATATARPLAGRISDARGVHAVAVPMMMLAAFGMLAAAFVDSFAGIAAAGVCMGAGQGSAYCALQAESVRGVSKDRVGRAANTFYLGPDLCMGLGPVLGGFVLQAAGAAALFLFNATAVLTGLGLLVVCGRRRADSAS